VLQQSHATVESFQWQWTQKTVRDNLKNFHRRLFIDYGLFTDQLQGQVVAYFGSGNGRHPWALMELTDAAKIISVELAPESIAYQKSTLTGERYEIIQGDMASVKIDADFIYLTGVIQHTADMEATLRNAWNCLKPNGELVVSFYMWTPTTICLEPIRQVVRRLPHSLAWGVAHVLAPIFMVRKAGREAGYKNAVHTAYDWNGSHSYQHYSTRKSIAALFAQVGIDERSIAPLRNKGNYKLKKYPQATLDTISETYRNFGA
jgi:2-polyprenyl-3-methyl-5-hydroxy-6-metoxy-1,4-benzoquinol methylase